METRTTTTVMSTTTTKRAARSVIIDCDPAGLIATGLDVDDDLALMVALAMHQDWHEHEKQQKITTTTTKQPKSQQQQQEYLYPINILGLTITDGNSQMEFSYLDAMELVHRRLGFTTIPIYKGATKKKQRQQTQWPLSLTFPFLSFLKSNNHNNNNNNNTYNSNNNSYTFYNNNYEPTDASRFIVKTIMEKEPPNTVSILALGPLANIVAAIQQEPKIVHRIHQIIFMGGVLNQNDHNHNHNHNQQKYHQQTHNNDDSYSTTTSTTTTLDKLDYNFRFDPYAASIVLSTPCPKIMIPIETAIQAAFGPKQLQHVQNVCNQHGTTNTTTTTTTASTTAPTATTLVKDDATDTITTTTWSSSSSSSSSSVQQQQPQSQPSQQLPVICSFQTRLFLQRYIMPWFVNPRYKQFHPKSSNFHDGFILWDVVALYVMMTIPPSLSLLSLSSSSSSVSLLNNESSTDLLLSSSSLASSLASSLFENWTWFDAEFIFSKEDPQQQKKQKQKPFKPIKDDNNHETSSISSRSGGDGSDSTCNTFGMEKSYNQYHYHQNKKKWCHPSNTKFVMRPSNTFAIYNNVENGTNTNTTDNNNNNNNSTNVSFFCNKVLVPRILKSEPLFHELFMKHVFITNATNSKTTTNMYSSSSSSSLSLPILTTFSSLGLLPYWFAHWLTIVILGIILIKIIIIPCSQNVLGAARMLKQSIVSNENNNHNNHNNDNKNNNAYSRSDDDRTILATDTTSKNISPSSMLSSSLSNISIAKKQV